MTASANGRAAGSCGGWVELLLVRHGETESNRDGRYQGRTDGELTGEGREQARALGSSPHLRSADAPVWCSTLRRSRRTARLAFPDRARRPDSRLDELDFGDLEGRTHREAEEELGSAYRSWLRNPASGAPPNGESMTSLRSRLCDWLRDLPRERTHLAVTHLGPIQVLTAMALDVPLSRSRRLKTEPGEWTRLLIPGDHPALRGDREMHSGAAPSVRLAADDASARVRELCENVSAPSGPPIRSVRDRVDALAKPPGSLGRLETAAVRLARVLGDPPPPLERRVVPVFLADHGVARRGVSAYPPEVTAAMCRVFGRGAAASQALAGACGVEVVPVDVGVDSEERGWDGITDLRIRRGTRDLSRGTALERGEARAAVTAGSRVVRSVLSEGGAPSDAGAAVVGLGEMGIGNTTSASAVAAVLTGRGPDEVVGPGTGVTGTRLERKRRIVAAVADRTGADAGPLETLASVGGLEIAAMSGACLEAAGRELPVLVDGFIATVAAAIAVRMAPAARQYLFASHRSPEPGHEVLLEELELDPLLDLELRLGEGTGAVLAAPILDAAGGLLRSTASIDDVTA